MAVNGAWVLGTWYDLFRLVFFLASGVSHTYLVPSSNIGLGLETIDGYSFSNFYCFFAWTDGISCFWGAETDRICSEPRVGNSSMVILGWVWVGMVSFLG